jgi:CubicO group peptidase (beta-lactamase class C family)
VEDLSPLLQDWPVDQVAAGLTDAAGTLATGGDLQWQVRTASLSKLLVGIAALVAVEEGAIALAEPAGPPGSTVEHLLAHASGLAFATDRVLAEPGRRRIYSNSGIEWFAGYLAARTGIDFPQYLRQAVIEPLGMRATTLAGSPAHDIVSTVDDLLRFIRELLRPSLVAPQTLADATTAHFPDLAGVLPGFGRHEPNPWGLTFEIRAHKDPHWTGARNSASTFGHFGAAGTFLWVDPVAGLGCVALTQRQFGSWARSCWPAFSDAVLQRVVGKPAGAA